MQSSLVRVSQLSEEPAASVIINSNNDDDDDGVGHLIINTVHVADNMGITSQKMVIFVQHLIVRFDVLIVLLLQVQLLWDMTACCLVSSSKRFNDSAFQLLETLCQMTQCKHPRRLKNLQHVMNVRQYLKTPCYSVCRNMAHVCKK